MLLDVPGDRLPGAFAYVVRRFVAEPLPGLGDVSLRVPDVARPKIREDRFLVIIDSMTLER